MCILESGRALQRLEEFGGYPVLGKPPLSQYYEVQLELGRLKIGVRVVLVGLVH